jgi:protein-S-isoprenylcysteine O-methyltransferase Ste14
MRIVALVIGIGWVTWGIYWVVSAGTTKAGRTDWGGLLAVRLVTAAVIVVVVILSRRHDVHIVLTSRPWLLGVGLAVWAVGLGLAVWARVYLGRNWGMPMTKKEQPELVETGPYRFIRHPIYTGVILGLLGSALATTLVGLAVVAVIVGYFVFSALREERYMTGLFPDAYPAYKHSTKMLVPFVF